MSDDARRTRAAGADGLGRRERPRREVRAGRTAFGRRTARRARALAASGTTETQRAATGLTGTGAYTRTRTASGGAAVDGARRGAQVRLFRAVRAARASLERAWRWTSATLTGLGLAMAIVVVAGAAFGYTLGWIELVAVAFTSFALLLLGVFFLLGRNSYDVGLSLDRDRVVVGDDVNATLLVNNPTRFRLPPVKSEVPVGRGLAEFYLGSIPRQGRTTRQFSVPTSRRGVVRLGPVRTVRADPIGLLRREYVWTSHLDLFVHPVTVPIPATSTGLIRDLEGNPTRDLTNSDVSFHALREYAPGDDRRHIHWKSTARTGQLMVRQFEETRRSHLVIALSLASADYHSEEEFELAVSVAGSIGIRAIRDARDVSVLASAELASAEPAEFARRGVNTPRRLSSLSRSRLLDDLARVEHSPRASALTGLARGIADSVSGASVAIIVCGSEATAAQLRSASAAFPPGVEVLAIVCNPGIVPSLRRVGELRVVTIGYLDDVQKALARAAS
ncbi:DUF58 domain-containing protein [Agreia sp.]|uniref:DUF58 domain-containing protein n=1 Tax=Agreia sp. TaxID=1872416 RepID=UPI0035BC83B7